MRGKPLRIDFIGLSLLSLGLAALELMLDKGQEHDWFDSPFIVNLALLAAVALVAVVFWELRHPRRSSTCGCSPTATSRRLRSASSVPLACCMVATCCCRRCSRP